MRRVYISEIKSGENVLLKGWVHEIRDLAKLKFILLRDMSGIVQCVVKDEKLLKNFSVLTLESVVEIHGKVKKSNVKTEIARNDVEVDVSELKILNKAENLPMHVNEKSVSSELPTRLDNRSLDIRKPRVKAIFKIQSTIANAFREFFYKKGFIEIQPPGIIATSTEGGTDIFEINYFDKKAYLAQSPQLYKQLVAISLEKVFSTSAVWRAEKHDTSKHINEIRQMDIEVAFCDDIEVMKYLEEAVRFIVSKVIIECKTELEILSLNLKIPNVKYLTYKEVIETLSKSGFKMKYGDDFEPEAERKICEIFPNSIIFTYEWPIELKPFYIWPKDEQKGISAGFDALFGGIEISSGGQRVHIPEILIKQLKSKKLNPENFKWYVDAFRYGAPMHSGWSIGLERITQAILKLDNIREATLFPRDRRRLTP
ncbi:aspartate--tRNA(Asn) ligase [Candidatus Pacearchaeota archaeon CG10_big_fil_rev_8_21_14_0_10_32_42]|nr:MAG: aspartate--tRNA(Asn) ligase [Candidatus Pacearchaeota archaeon CG10_big_fil_rev_8_21_14_0_10_32_42]